MHSHRSVPWPEHVARPGSRRYEIQRQVLLELVVDPPAAGESVAELALRLGRSRAAVAVAVRDLVAAGLAARTGGGVTASPVALAFEALLPARL